MKVLSHFAVIAFVILLFIPVVTAKNTRTRVRSWPWWAAVLVYIFGCIAFFFCMYFWMFLQLPS